MNEYTVADGEIPIWLLDDGEQIAATESPRNNYPIPEATASTTSASTRQNQPNLAAQDDTQVEVNSNTPVAANTAIPGTDPLLTPPAPTPEPKASSSKSSTKATSTKSGTKKTASTKSSGTKKGKRPTKKFDEPTLITYTVRPGDNLSTIAERSRTTVAQIRRDSGIKGDLIHPGQTIKVRYTPKNYKPGKKSSSKGKTSKAKTYTVKSGDTISAIAARHGVTTAQVMKANNLTAAKARRILPGQKLTIPAK